MFVRPDFQICPVWTNAKLVATNPGEERNPQILNELLDTDRQIVVNVAWNLGVEQQVMCDYHMLKNELSLPISQLNPADEEQKVASDSSYTRQRAR